MKKSYLFVFYYMIVGLLLMNCAPTAKVPITTPAEINLRGVNKIVIGDIKGNAGKNYGDLLTSRLFESNKFEVLDRENLDRVMKEHRLSASGAVDPKTAVKIGKIIGASALVAGTVNKNYQVKRWKGDRWKDKKGKYHQSHYIKGIARINANIKVIGLTTGKVLAVKSISTQADKKNQQNLRYPAAPDKESLLGRATEESLDKFMQMIAPYTTQVTVKFAKAKTPQGKNAIQMAKNGLWQDALELFESAKNSNPSYPGAWYNLGLCYQYNYMFPEAENAFKKCTKIKASKKCIQGIQNVRQMAAEQKKLEQQGVHSSGK